MPRGLGGPGRTARGPASDAAPPATLGVTGACPAARFIIAFLSETFSAIPIVCDRGGAACDLLVEDENMREVADWIIETLPFDRLYFYGIARPIHISFGPQHSRAAYEMFQTESGAVVPRPLKT
jgi:hypothetical protein